MFYVSAQAWVSNCASPYMLESLASKHEYSKWWAGPPLTLEYIEGLGALSQIYTDTKVPAGLPYTQSWDCDNDKHTSLPMVVPC